MHVDNWKVYFRSWTCHKQTESTAKLPISSEQSGCAWAVTDAAPGSHIKKTDPSTWMAVNASTSQHAISLPDCAASGVAGL